MDVLQRAHAIYSSRRGANYEHIDANGTPEATFAQVIDRLAKRADEDNSGLSKFILPVLQARESRTYGSGSR
jgi:hypothetical protein